MINDILDFALAVLTRWSALLTGGVVAAAVAVYSYFGRRRLGKRAYAAILLLYFVGAAFLVWRGERVSRRLAERDLQQREAAIATVTARAEKSAQEFRASEDALRKTELLLHQAQQQRQAPRSVADPGALQDRSPQAQQDLDERARSRALRTNLAELIEEAGRLQMRCLTEVKTDQPVKDTNNWAERTYTYLKSVDVSLAARFNNPPAPLPLSHTNVPDMHDNAWRFIETRKNVLNGMLEQGR